MSDPLYSQSDPNTAGINQPELSEATLKPKKRAIDSPEQAYNVATGLESNNATRNEKNAVIEDKYNGGPPHKQSDLISAGEDWRSNASFGFMSSIIDRIIPVPLKVVDSVKWFTSAGLDPKVPDSEKKSEAFREVTTNAMRQWDYWKDFIASVVREDVLIGGCFVAWMDDDNPFPQMFRQDEGFVPEGTGQHAKTAQFFAAKAEWLIHEAVEFIENKEAADAAGWEIENMVTTINAAMPRTRPENSTMGAGNARSYEDIVREGNAGTSFSVGARVIEVWHVLACEADGKVTHYIVNRNGKHELLFQQDDRYDQMTDCLCLFTLEQGNSKFYGSKGTGRKLINDHISIERARNRTIDQIYMSGMGIAKTDPTKALDMQVRVKFPFVIVGTDASFEQLQIQHNVEAFLKLDAFFSNLAEQLVGAYLPDSIAPENEGPEKTATENRIDYTREQQAQSASWARFDGQFSNMMSTFQRRLYKKGSTNEVAKEARRQLVEDYFLTEEEIEFMANRPASEVAQDMSQVENRQIAEVFALLRGDPRIDQQKLYDMAVRAMSNTRIGKSLVIDDEFDPTIKAEQVAKQIMENAVIQIGDSINISPRDDDMTHLEVLGHELSQAIPGIQANPDPKLLDNFSAALVHAQAHIDSWKAKRGDQDKEEIAKFEQGLKEAEGAIKQIAKQMLDQQQQAGAPQQQVPGVPGGQPAVQPEPIHPEEHMLKITSSIAYKDAPEDIRRQIEAAAGFTPSKIGGGPIDYHKKEELEIEREAVRQNAAPDSVHDSVTSVNNVHAAVHPQPAEMAPPPPPVEEMPIQP